jgi:DNA-binding transcriptional ArsR family regulator
VERTDVRTNVRLALRVAGMSADRDTCDLLCLDLPKAERVRAALPPLEQLATWAAAAKGLGDPTRLAIALALRDGERACVCDLAWILGRDEKLVSHHLRQLKAAGLARSQRDGKMVMYELTARGRALLTAIAPEEARA